MINNSPFVTVPGTSVFSVEVRGAYWAAISPVRRRRKFIKVDAYTERVVRKYYLWSFLLRSFRRKTFSTKYAKRSSNCYVATWLYPEHWQLDENPFFEATRDEDRVDRRSPSFFPRRAKEIVETYSTTSLNVGIAKKMENARQRRRRSTRSGVVPTAVFLTRELVHTVILSYSKWCNAIRNGGTLNDRFRFERSRYLKWLEKVFTRWITRKSFLPVGPILTKVYAHT